jgi:hypothetical protein
MVYTLRTILTGEREEELMAELDYDRMRAMLEEGCSEPRIAEAFGTTRDRLKRHIRKVREQMRAEGALPDRSPVPRVDASIHGVDTGIPEDLLADVHELVAWWRARREALQGQVDADRETRRVTFFVEKRWEEAIRRQADLDGLTYTQIVNEAFRQFFTR